MRTLILLLLLTSRLFGQRAFVRNEKLFLYGYLRETDYYQENGISEAEITWRDSVSSKVVQYAHTFMVPGHHPSCLSAECIKYKNDSTKVVIKADKSGETIERTYIHNKLIKQQNLNPNTGCTECYDPVKNIN